MYFPRFFKKKVILATRAVKTSTSHQRISPGGIASPTRESTSRVAKKKVFISFSSLAATLQTGDVCHIVKTALYPVIMQQALLSGCLQELFKPTLRPELFCPCSPSISKAALPASTRYRDTRPFKTPKTGSGDVIKTVTE